MPVKPIGLVSGDLKIIGTSDFDISVLPSTIVRTDGSTPFTAAQTGVDPTAATHLTTKQWVQANTGSIVWIGPVLSMTTTAQPSHSAGARYLIPAGATGAVWAGQPAGTLATDDGTTWTLTAPVTGWVAYVVDLDILVRFKTSTNWADVSTVMDHAKLASLQGGTSGEYYHLTSAQLTGLTGSQTQHYAYLAPLGSSGAPSFRALSAADVLTGSLATARGGLGLDSSSSSGYAKWTAGSVAFSATIPWTDLSSVPTSFTPAAHAASHASAGSDPISIDGTQITSGFVGVARGGTGTNASSLTAKYFFASPTATSGAASFRPLVVADFSGATAAYQVIRRNSANTANEWGDVPLRVDKDASLVGRRPTVNFSGDVTVTDDSVNNRINVAVTSSASMDPIVAAIVFGG